MIHLTLNESGEPKRHSFNVDTLTVGSNASSPTHLQIRGENLPESLLEISVMPEGYACFLSAELGENGVTCNGEPFEGGALEYGDTLQLGSLSLTLQAPEESSAEASPSSDLDALFEDLEELQTPSPTAEQAPQLPEALETLFEEELSLPEELQEIHEEAEQEEKERAEEEPEPAPPSLDEEPSPLTPPLEEEPDTQEEELDLSEDLSSLEDLFADIDDLGEIEEEVEESGEIDGLDIDKLLEELDLADSPEGRSQGDEEDDELELEFSDDSADAFLMELPEVQEEEEAEEKEQISSQEPTPLPQEESEADASSKIALVEEEEPATTFFDGYEEDGDFDYEADYEVDEELEKRQWQQKMVLMALAILLLSLSSGLSTYFVIKRGNVAQEVTAARGLADVAMALTHARLGGRVPFNGNWTDSEFINFGMEATLSPEYRKLSPINENVEYKETPYFITVYATSNLDRFLALAVPQKTWQQWLAPKPILVIGSDQMEIRQMTRPRQWWTTLRDENSLDFVNAIDVNGLLSQEILVRLPSLNGDDRSQGFEAPSELALSFAAAENYVYNAPRYYKFTQSVAKKLTSFYDDGAVSLEEIEALKLNCSRLAQLPHMTLYSLEGSQGARKLSEGLTTLEIGQGFYMGHLQLGEEDRLVDSAQLLPGALNRVIANEPAKEAEQKEEFETPAFTSSYTSRLEEHTLFQKVRDAVQKRRSKLKKLSQDIVDLLEEHNLRNLPDFEDRHHELTQRYQRAIEEEKALLRETLANLYERHVRPDRENSLPIFTDSVEFFGLEELIPTHLSWKMEQTQSEADTPLERQLLTIERSNSIEELEKSLGTYHKTASQALQSLNAKKATTLSNQLRAVTLKKVAEFVLSSEHLSDLELTEPNYHDRVEQILSQGGISDQQVREFYLSEFDRLVVQLRQLKEEDQLSHLERQRDKIVSSIEEYEEYLTPEARKDLDHQVDQAELAILNEEAKIEAIEERIERVPLDRPATMRPADRKQELGRMGQQILVKEAETLPSPTRDARLLESIGLLAQATDSHRAFWEDLLEARRLLLATPEQEIQKVLNSPLGFHSTGHSTIQATVSQLKEFIRAKRALAENLTQEGEFAVLIELFSQKQEGRLQEIITKAESIYQSSESLEQGLNHYIAALRDFQQDYDRAKNEGLLTKQRLYHSTQLRRLNRKTKNAQALQERTQTLTQQLKKLATDILSITREELSILNDGHSASLKEAAQLQQRANRLYIPNLVAEQLPHQMSKVFRIHIRPQAPKEI